MLPDETLERNSSSHQHCTEHRLINVIPYQIVWFVT